MTDNLLKPITYLILLVTITLAGTLCLYHSTDSPQPPEEQWVEEELDFLDKMKMDEATKKIVMNSYKEWRQTSD